MEVKFDNEGRHFRRVAGGSHRVHHGFPRVDEESLVRDKDVEVVRAGLRDLGLPRSEAGTGGVVDAPVRSDTFPVSACRSAFLPRVPALPEQQLALRNNTKPRVAIVDDDLQRVRVEQRGVGRARAEGDC